MVEKTHQENTTMPVSEAKRKANQKWDAENMTVIGCKVRKDVAEAFKAECKRRGTTVNAVFLQAMRDFMENEPFVQNDEAQTSE